MEPVTAAVRGALAERDGPLFVGFSGGLDSSVLLHALSRVCTVQAVVALHVDHGLHPDSRQWLDQAAAFCRDLGIPLRTQRAALAPAGNLEARARRARYDFFEQALKAGGTLLLAHHADDQLETLLLRLVQGRGVLPMPGQRPLGCGELLRPLLGLPRAALAEYAAAEGLPFVQDPSNQHLQFERNYLRHRVAPRLSGRWPEAAVRAAAAARALEQERGLLEALIERCSSGPGGQQLPLSVLTGLSAAQQALLLRRWLEGHGLGGLTGRALEDFVRQVFQPDDRQPLLHTPAADVRRHGGALHLVRPGPALAACYPLTGRAGLRLPHGRLNLAPGRPGFPWQDGLEVRFRRGGEVLRPLAGSAVRLKDLLRDAGLPPWQRDRLPLVFHGQRLLAVPGIADIGDQGDNCLCAEWIFD